MRDGVGTNIAQRVTKAGEDWFCLAGLWRSGVAVKEGVGEAFTLLTTEPGPDVAPYHSRQVVVVERRDWGAWLDGSVAAGAVCVPLAAGVLRVGRSMVNLPPQRGMDSDV